MWRAELRRMRDRVFVPFIWEKHWVRAFSVVKNHASSWDLFPPVSGYRPFSKAKGSYNVSPQRQHSDWSKKVIDCAGHQCTHCGNTGHIEAHHLWPQGWFPNLRYLLRNGIALCRPCHENAPWKQEITPNQFKWLIGEISHINSNIERPDFWDYYTSAIQKGRVIIAGISELEFDITSPAVIHQLEYFKELDGYNGFRSMFIRAATTLPHADPDFVLNDSLWTNSPPWGNPNVEER